MPDGDLLQGRKRIAHAVGVSERTISRWARAGIIQAKKPGGQTSPLRIERRDLEDLISKRK